MSQPEEGTSTHDFPLEAVGTFADLVELMNRLYARAIDPTLRNIELILAGREEPSLTDVLSFLEVCGVAAQEVVRWRDAWSRAAAHRGSDHGRAVVVPHQPAVRGEPPPAGPYPPAGLSGVDDAEWQAWAERQAWDLRRRAEELREHTATQLLQARRRCADRLRSLSLEVAEMRSVTAPDELLERTLALSQRAQDIIDDAHRDVLSTPVMAAGASTRTASADGPAADGSATSWLSKILQLVPMPIAARMLQAVDITIVTSIALDSPQLMGKLLGTLPPTESARWLPDWPPEAAVAVLSTMEPSAAGRCMEPMEGHAAALLAAMRREAAADVLWALPRETTSRWLSEMDRSMAAELLQLFDLVDTADHLLWIEELGLGRPGEFVIYMTETNANQCLRHMDRRRSQRRLAAELVQRIAEAGRNNDEGI